MNGVLKVVILDKDKYVVDKYVYHLACYDVVEVCRIMLDLSEQYPRTDGYVYLFTTEKR